MCRGGSRGFNQHIKGETIMTLFQTHKNRLYRLEVTYITNSGFAWTMTRSEGKPPNEWHSTEFFPTEQKAIQDCFKKLNTL
jgi:hypothetical protein